MVHKLYDDAKVLALLVEAKREGADWHDLGPELAYQLQEVRREMHSWMLETRHATEIADTWRRRYEELSNAMRGN